MENPGPRFAAWAPHILGALRIVTGFLFLQHGSAKLFGGGRRCVQHRRGTAQGMSAKQMN